MKILSPLFCLILLACGGVNEPNNQLPGTPVVQPQYGDQARSDLLRDTEPDVAAAEILELTAGNRGFAFDLYQHLRTEESGNFFYSPHSISLALAMTFAGARNQTEEDMAAAMHFLPQERLHPAVNALDLALMERGKGAQGRDGDGFRLNVANALWAQHGLPLLMDFLDVLAVNYGAGLRLLDFSDTASAAATINGWVSDETEGRIDELLVPADLAGALLVLTNAIYFNAQWEQVFNDEWTANGTFTRLDGSQVDAPMMTTSDMFMGATGEGWVAGSLPYDGKELDMVVIVPDQGRFGEIEDALSVELVDDVLAAVDASVDQYSVILPKWQNRSEVSLKQALDSMGMGNAFSGAADFSGMTGGRDLFIGDVIHEATISVDEYGTEAAAATAVVMFGGVPDEVRADRPFIYVIRDIATNAVLFVGRVVDPTA